jgi:excisionase family DNA binding protein
MFTEAIYTVEEVAEHLRVPVEVVREEIKLGRLQALNVGGHARVREADLNKYKSEVSKMPMCTVIAPANANLGFLKLRSASDFDHKWPDGSHERYGQVQEGLATYDGKTYDVKLGFTVREAAGKPRRRGLVLINRYATVEFAGPDPKVEKDNDVLASVIKTRDGKQLPANAPVPVEYQGLPVGSYREVVDGPWASNGMAVICASQDFDTMVMHALIRHKYREERD